MPTGGGSFGALISLVVVFFRSIAAIASSGRIVSACGALIGGLTARFAEVSMVISCIAFHCFLDSHRPRYKVQVQLYFSPMGSSPNVSRIKRIKPFFL